MPDGPGSPCWPRGRQLLFNLLVLGSAALALVAYVVILQVFRTTIGRPFVDASGTPTGVYDLDVDGPPFGPLLPCCGVVVLLPAVNLLYLAGPVLADFLEILFTRDAFDRRPHLAWWVMTLPLCLIPWAIPLIHLVLCLFYPSAYNQTPIPWP